MGRTTGSESAPKPRLEAVEIEIDDRCGEQSKELAEDESADDSDAERATEFGANTSTKRER